MSTVSLPLPSQAAQVQRVSQALALQLQQLTVLSGTFPMPTATVELVIDALYHENDKEFTSWKFKPVA